MFSLYTEPETNYEEEMQILRVIEAYCSLSASTTNKQRHTFSTTSSKFLFLCIYLFINKKIETHDESKRWDFSNVELWITGAPVSFQTLWGQQYRVGMNFSA